MARGRRADGATREDPMRKVMVSLMVSAIMTGGAVAGFQGVTGLNAAQSARADHAVIRVENPGGACPSCRLGTSG
jgi:hypothetical protein